MTAAISALIVLVVAPLLGWLLKRYLFDKKPLTEGQKIEKEVVQHNHDAVNTRLNDNLDRLLGDEGEGYNKGAGSGSTETKPKV
jgi:hypothetical protein